MSKKRKQTAFPSTRPDLDNYLRAATDCATGILWKDDSIILSIQTSKAYSEEPFTLIEVYPLKDPTNPNQW